MAAAEKWRNRGCKVLTPFEANNAAWRELHQRDFDPDNDRCEYGDPLMRRMFALDTEILCKSDFIVLLPGWETSKGALAEVHLANTLHIPIYDIEGLPLKIKTTLTFDVHR